MSHPYIPYAKPLGVFIGIVILWAANLGLFLLGIRLFNAWVGGDAEAGA